MKYICKFKFKYKETICGVEYDFALKYKKSNELFYKKISIDSETNISCAFQEKDFNKVIDDCINYILKCSEEELVMLAREKIIEKENIDIQQAKNEEDFYNSLKQIKKKLGKFTIEI